MCGIVGLAYRDSSRPVDREQIQRMCAAIKHPGPDDEGLFVEGAVGLGMRRLSIIDLSGGQQPIFNEDGSKVIVFNGEIYNYRDLRERLIARGHVLRTHSDTETVLHLYEDMGPDCARELRGMFTFAIWDKSRGTLLLARDRFGIKPLYVLTAPWGVAFASELKALHASRLTSRVLDWEALDMFLQLGYIPAPASPFQDVRKLEPGHTMVWSGTGDTVVRRYWHLPTETTAAPRDAEARVREWVDESVTAHLVSDVPVALFLSGGLDSSAVAASMSLVASPPHAFTARYHGSGKEAADETGLARALADRYGIDLISVVDIEPEIRDIRANRVRPRTSRTPTTPPSHPAPSERVGASYKVALTGIGGDELRLSGYAPPRSLRAE
jgi:asparagine synthase (glutamine-hydrolysing)